MADIPDFLKAPGGHEAAPAVAGRAGLVHLTRGMGAAAGLIRHSYTQWELAGRTGALSKLDPRFKVLLWLVYLILVSLIVTLPGQAAVFAGVFAVAAGGRVGGGLAGLRGLYAKVLALGFFFGTLAALPAGLNIITPGEMLIPLLTLGPGKSVLGHPLPEVLGISAQGARAVSLLTLRVMNSLSISFLVLYSTPLVEIIRALRTLRVPETALMVITLTYKYIFLFARTVEDMHKARLSRLTGPDGGRGARAWAAQAVAHLFIRTRRRCEETHNAMLARGGGIGGPGTGTALVTSGPAGLKDWLAGGALLLPAALWAVIKILALIN